ncbi:response regulator transcription factor [filamentous cyanobacterium LEGE 11480]|uniref:Response regulator transcription factor n=1 Tax=Romeriopsis navalis LEGE 11480 TaxID=2777977 RepID=A0A928Z3L1_9CYAN|nr:response regulator transcription factor [Romeriopsis navalis]MBE9030137.1 response regulator transcription factor [Romeriopsis navalis LEGE 11480]
MSAHILLLEDDPKLAQFVEMELRLEGYEVTLVTNGMDGLQQARETSPDLLILDWMTPGISGLDVCMRLRSTGTQAPIIMLTARDEIPDRVAGLNAGADDYVTKPFSIEELLARVNAHLRRLQPESSEGLTFEDLALNCITREVYRAGQLVQLTAKEFDLLEFLMRHPRQVVSREQILEQVWGYDFVGESNIIEVYMRALRIKLEASQPQRLIQTVRGVGYALREPS